MCGTKVVGGGVGDNHEELLLWEVAERWGRLFQLMQNLYYVLFENDMIKASPWTLLSQLTFLMWIRTAGWGVWW